MTDERLQELKGTIQKDVFLGDWVKIELLAEVERLRALTTPQPIETAPKDGTPFMALRKSMYGFVSCQTAYFDDDGDCLNEDSVVLEPTHWLTLPKMEVLK